MADEAQEPDVQVVTDTRPQARMLARMAVKDVAAMSLEETNALPAVASDAALMLARGIDLPDVVTELGLMPVEVYRWLKHPEFRKLVKSYLPSRDEVELEMDMQIPAALRARRQIMSSPTVPMELKRSTANDILDARGYGKVHKVEKVVRILDDKRFSIFEQAFEEAFDTEGGAA